MGIVFSLVDERLVHGQVINQWIMQSKATHLVIIDNALDTNDFMSKIYLVLIPISVEAKVLSQSKAASYIKEINSEDNRVFLLAKTPEIFAQLLKDGILVESVVLGDRSFSKNKLEVAKTKKEAIDFLISADVKLYTRDADDELKNYQ